MIHELKESIEVFGFEVEFEVDVIANGFGDGNDVWVGFTMMEEIFDDFRVF